MGRYFWPVIGVSTVAFSAWLLYGELRNTSIEELQYSLRMIPLRDWGLAVCATILAYACLAGYDHVVLLHLRKKVDWRFVTLCSFTTYALAHNIGASVFSGSVVRYRGYSTRGLSAAEVGVLVAFCSLTFVLGTMLLSGLVLVLKPEIGERLGEVLPVGASTVVGVLLLLGVAFYVLGSVLGLRPMRIGRLNVEYPRPGIVLRQLIVGPLELIGAAAIIYFALPEAGNPGFITVLGIFLASFSMALLSHAPGGLGVLELVFVLGMPDMAPQDVLAALLVFRLLYLLVPLAIALFVVVGFERAQLNHSRSRSVHDASRPRSAPTPSRATARGKA